MTVENVYKVITVAACYHGDTDMHATRSLNDIIILSLVQRRKGLSRLLT